jgi:diguanylate cyclase (GGDEF)-like protein
LITKADLVGVLTLYSSNRDGFNPDHERVVEIIARQVSPVLKHAADFQVEKARSLRDELTGLPNIGQFVQFSKSAQRAGGGTIAPAVLLLIDIDNLRRVNEDFGDRIGDTVLSHVVDCTRRLLRPSDVLFRHEDDQFIAVLLHTSEATGKTLSDRLVHAVAASRSDLPLSVTITTALAAAPIDSSTFEGLLEVARHRLAKQLPPGNNQPNNDRIH